MANLLKSSVASVSNGQSASTAETKVRRLDREIKLKRTTICMSTLDMKQRAGNQLSIGSTRHSANKDIRVMGLKEQQSHMEEVSKDNFSIKLNYALEMDRNSKLRDILLETDKELEEKKKELTTTKEELSKANTKIEELVAINERLHQTLEVQDAVIEDARFVNLSFQQRFKEFQQESERDFNGRLECPENMSAGIMMENHSPASLVADFAQTGLPSPTLSNHRFLDTGDTNISIKEVKDAKDNGFSSGDDEVSETAESLKSLDTLQLPGPSSLSDSDMRSLYNFINGTPARTRPIETTENKDLTPPDTPTLVRRSMEELLDSACAAAEYFLQAGDLVTAEEGRHETHIEDDIRNSPERDESPAPEDLAENPVEEPMERIRTHPSTQSDYDLLSDFQELPIIFLANRRLALASSGNPSPPTSSSSDDSFEMLNMLSRPPSAQEAWLLTPSQLESAQGPKKLKTLRKTSAPTVLRPTMAGRCAACDVRRAIRDDTAGLAPHSNVCSEGKNKRWRV